MFYQRGFTLIEILVSMLLLSIVLLGMHAMQYRAIHQSRVSLYTSLALNQLSWITTMLSITRGKDLDIQVKKWNEQNTVVLPQGRGGVSGVYPDYDINIFWGATSANNCEHMQVGMSGCLKKHLSL